MSIHPVTRPSWRRFDAPTLAAWVLASRTSRGRREVAALVLLGLAAALASWALADPVHFPFGWDLFVTYHDVRPGWGLLLALAGALAGLCGLVAAASAGRTRVVPLA